MDFGSLILLGNALVLGIRHGIDWDHIAAIADIVGTNTTSKINAGSTAIFEQRAALRLSSCYAMGHATIVFILGTLALMFSTVLPAWIDPLMGRAVGVTLLILGTWIFYSLLRYTTNREEFILQSRWMLLLSQIRQAGSWLYSRLTGEEKRPETKLNQYNAPSTFGIGVIHGFGAETGTQVLLIATVSGSTHVLGVLILLSFILGLLISNTLVALMTCAGFVGSAKFKFLFVGTSVLTGLFSLIIGLLFVSGCAGVLPNLQH